MITETVLCDAQGAAWLEDASSELGLPCVTVIGRCCYEVRVTSQIAQAFRHMNLLLDNEDCKRQDRMWAMMTGV